MAIDPLIKKETDVIRNEQWADKVRSSIANGLDYMSEDVVEIDNRQKSLESDFVAVQQDARSNTPSGAELAVAAGEYNTLGERLDAEEQKVAAQLAQNFGKEINILNYKNLTDDDTGMFFEAIKAAYAATPETTGWREPIVIKIPPGRYTINQTLIKSEDYELFKGARFVFRGSGYQNTIINFTGDSESYLFDNNTIFGFSSFVGISFVGNNLNRFLNGVGGGSGNAQAFLFQDCSFSRFNELIKSSGTTMMSEVTFLNCKIKEFDSTSKIFVLGNSQAVNWRFYATDIESFSGKLFHATQGPSISIYQGSIIPLSGGVIFDVPSNADYNSFGSGNSPHIQTYGVRFEMRGLSKLLQVANPSVKVDCVFDNTNLGMSNQTLSPSHFPLDLWGRGKIVFNNCKNMYGLKMSSKVNGASDYLQPLVVIFNDEAPNDLFIQDSVIVFENNPQNTAASPIVLFSNCGLNTTIRLSGNSKRVPIGMILDSKKHYISFLPTYNNIYQYSSSAQKFAVNLPHVNLMGIRIKTVGTSAYGGVIYKIKIQDVETGTIFVDREINTNQSEMIDIPMINHKFSNTGVLEFVVSPVTNVSSTITVAGLIELEY